MIRPRILLGAAILAVTTLLASCGSSSTTSTSTSSSSVSSSSTAPSSTSGGAGTTAAESGSGTAESGTRIKYVINGTLGDKSFIDSAYRGLTALSSMGYELKTVELGYDESSWESGLADAAAGDDYDILVAGSFSMSDYVGRVAPEYPDKKFWVYDAPPDYTGKVGCSNKCENVYSVTFKQNEGSYLVGYLLQKLIAADALPNANGRSKVGIVGGQDIPVINDFIDGFTNGFTDAGGTAENVLVQYVGGDKAFNDPARGKEISTSMFDSGAVAVWGVAGGSGAGVMEAAADAGLYSVGVDSDQFLTVTDDKLKATILTSMVKNVDAALERAGTMNSAGTLVYGAAENVGVADDGVGIATDNANFTTLVPADIATDLQSVYAKVKAGEITVATAF